MHRLASCLAGLLAAGTVWAEVETFRIDSEHSFANWEVRHLVGRVSGSFPGVSGTLVLDRNNLANSKVEASIDVYSLGTGHAKRDLHLLGDEFFDARKYPEMTFISTAVQPSGPDKGVVTGQLTVRGITRPAKMAYQILGFGNDPWDGHRVGLMAVMNVNRADFWVVPFGDNGPIGNVAEVTLLVEGIKLAADGKPYSVKKAAEEKARAAPPAPAQPVPAKEDSLEDQLKKRLKGLFN
jgi:polyisoprenoid-binding protein YceI